MLFETYITSPCGPIKIVTDEVAVKEVTILEQAAEESSNLPMIALEAKQQLTDYFNGVRTSFDLELQPVGTAFQQKVWQLLTEIPYGETVTYLQMAEQLGDVKVIRAAASANGKNPIGIIIPCHRVIGQNGKLVGYAGGLPNKRWLLDHEKEVTHGKWELF